MTYTHEYDPDYKNNETGTTMVFLELYKLSRTSDSFYIYVDSGKVTYTQEYDPDPQNQTGKPWFSGNQIYYAETMVASTLLLMVIG